jgi:AraC-like DNA-binding protein
MEFKETIATYFQRYERGFPQAGQVAAYRIEEVPTPAQFPFVRHDFYKIKLLCGAQGTLRYADKQVPIEGCALVFVNPLIPFAWERTGGAETGFACLFTEGFITGQLRTASVAGSPLFRAGGTPVLFPPPAAEARLRGLFELVLMELQSTYAHKYELLRNYLHIILHESLKLTDDVPAGSHPAATQLSTRFLELLDRQFPLASPQQPVVLRNANEFAQHLAVHTNHLNKVVQATTGRPTTAHIAERLAEEAKALLRHSNWSVTDIGYALGFGHASNFNSFFRRHVGQPPQQYRRQPLANS